MAFVSRFPVGQGICKLYIRKTIYRFTEKHYVDRKSLDPTISIVVAMYYV